MTISTIQTHNKTCVICNTTFFHKHTKVVTCSPECHSTRLFNNQQKSYKKTLEKKRLKSIEKFKDANPDDYVECQICGLRADHLGFHPTVHGLTCDEYVKQYGPLVSKTRSLSLSGDKNPAYGHGGKFSPFSKNFIKYEDLSEDERKERCLETKITATKSREDNGNITTRIEYFIKQGMTEDEAKQALSERQSTFNLQKCIEKYGEEAGRIRWQERQDTWQNTLNSKSDEERAEINKRKSTKFNFRELWNKDLTDPGWFYIINIGNSNYKIGVTTKHTIENRYSKTFLSDKTVILFEQQVDIHHAFMIEQVLKRKYANNITSNRMLGWTETFDGISIDQLLSDVDFLKNNESVLTEMFNDIRTKDNHVQI